MPDYNDKDEIKKRIEEIEFNMVQIGFWDDKINAQNEIKELQELKDKLAGASKYDKGNAVLNIISGAGGDDSEDFARMLLEMYYKYCAKRGWQTSLIHDSMNDHGGYKNVSILISGNGVYGTLRNESGVHRLVRISPFNAKKLRHTSFALVEVLPEIKKLDATDFEINENDLKIEFSKSGGPGGQNVNKRETAVRIVHIPTNISVHASTERSQEANKDRAMSILRAKLYTKINEDEKKRKEGLSITKTVDIEWGNQIRSYVTHPYKMVKDLRTNFETSDVDGVFAGDIDGFIEAEREM